MIRKVKLCIYKLQQELFTKRVMKYISENQYNRNITIHINDPSVSNINSSIIDNLLVSTNIQMGIQWMILKQIIECDWEYFFVLGFEINDDTILQKFLALISALFITINIVDLIQVLGL